MPRTLFPGSLIWHFHSLQTCCGGLWMSQSVAPPVWYFLTAFWHTRLPRLLIPVQPMYAHIHCRLFLYHQKSPHDCEEDDEEEPFCWWRCSFIDNGSWSPVARNQWSSAGHVIDSLRVWFPAEKAGKIISSQSSHILHRLLFRYSNSGSQIWLPQP